jgi:hypothetical protein
MSAAASVPSDLQNQRCRTLLNDAGIIQVKIDGIRKNMNKRFPGLPAAVLKSQTT